MDENPKSTTSQSWYKTKTTKDGEITISEGWTQSTSIGDAPSDRPKAENRSTGRSESRNWGSQTGRNWGATYNPEPLFDKMKEEDASKPEKDTD